MDEIKKLNLAPSKKKKTLKKIPFKLVTVALGVLAVFILWSSSTSPEVFNTIFGAGPTLEVENDRVNILLLGMAGGVHEGATLTDTIMVASYNIKTNHVDLVSLPRDLWIEEQKAKVNTLFQTGSKEDKGLEFARLEIGKILGLKIPYSIRADFDGFTKAVDLVGGLEVEVARTFDDYLYPIEGKKDDMCGYSESEVELTEEAAKPLNLSPGKYLALVAPDGKIATTSAMIKPETKNSPKIDYTPEMGYKLFVCRYEHINFTEGKRVMNGETALKFVRSRTGTNGEGSDFARSRRQQLVLAAFKDKILSLDTLKDPQKIISLITTFGNSVETDIAAKDYLDFVNLGRDIKSTKSYVIDFQGEKPLLTTPKSGNFGGAWVLVPTSGDYSGIQQFVKDILSGAKESTPSGQLQKAE